MRTSMPRWRGALRRVTLTSISVLVPRAVRSQTFSLPTPQRTAALRWEM